ncbi:MAG: hypothetical protein WA888_06920 [Burkholderiaceae bacterium]
MFHAIRLVVGLGLLATLGYTIAYFLFGAQRYLVIALRALLITAVIAAVLGLGIWVEHLTR